MQYLGTQIIAVARRKIIAVSAGLSAGIGRSLCRRWPVSMPASAGLYAGIGQSLCLRRPVSVAASAGLYGGIGRSLCRRRPVSMPASAGLYAGVGRSLCRPTPFRLCRRALRGFFSAKTASQQEKTYLLQKMLYFCRSRYFGQY